MPVTAGDVVVKTITHGELVRWKIEHADPLIEISEQILADLNPRFATLDGEVLTLRGCNRTLIYRIDWDSYDPQRRTYRAEWPD